MVYIVEDDNSIRDLVVYSLNNVGITAKGFPKPSMFWEEIQQELPQLILLDVMLPEESGLDILKKLRSNTETEQLPIIMLTAKDSEYDRVLGLDLGADDYISKPFGIMELIARVKALIRRVKSKASDSDTYMYNNLTLSSKGHKVTVNGEEIILTYKEFELLHLLMVNKGLVLTRDRILQDIWGYDFDGENRTVDVHIRTLRSKLGECGNYIETVRGIGYKLG